MCLSCIFAVNIYLAVGAILTVELWERSPGKRGKKMGNKKQQEKPACTHDYASRCVELFENILEKQGVALKSGKRVKKGEDGKKHLSGKVYKELVDGTEKIFTEMSGEKPEGEDVYTHDLAALCVELFEGVLDDYDVTLSSPEDDEKEEGNGARLYGSTYSELLDFAEDIFIEFAENQGIPFVEGEFSGTI